MTRQLLQSARPSSLSPDPPRRSDGPGESSGSSSARFIAMLAAYRATGGTARGDDLARLLEDRHCGDFVTLARLIVAREVFGFAWRNTFWVPMFQFEMHDLSIKPATRHVLAELAPAFDGWDVASWFTRPNGWLDDRPPVDLIGSNLAAVLGAARADRFVSAG
ncbi:MAG: hypothetical protein ABI702_19220 [Burkholderiales bacterium]